VPHPQGQSRSMISPAKRPDMLVNFWGLGLR
jgi:hypothetical protein